VSQKIDIPNVKMTLSLIRSCRESDLSAIQEIYAVEVLASTASFEIEPPDVKELKRRIRRVKEANLPYLVADIDNQIAGFAYVTPYRLRAAYRYTVESSIYVARWTQGQGIGTQLLQELVMACKNIGVRQMIAIIGGGENIASIRIHEKTGFRKIGTLKNVGWKFESWIDTVVMQLELQESD